MLLFSTILPISDALTPDDFIRLAIECNQTNPYDVNVIPGIVWNGERNIRFGSDDLWMEIGEFGDTVAVRYEKTDAGGAVWDTDYVMNFAERKMSVRLDRSYLESALNTAAGFSTPAFINMLIERGYLLRDGDLPVTNRPIMIDDNRLNAVAAVIRGESDYELPVVYVSKTYYNDDPVDVEALAYRLKGVAHVLVQRDGRTNGVLRRETGDRNEYSGAIGVYFPNAAVEHKRFLYREYETDSYQMEKVIRCVIQYSNAQMVDPLYTWTGVNNARLREMYGAQKEETLAAELLRAQAVGEAEDLVASVDQEIVGLRARIEQLTKANDALTYENQGLRAKIGSLDDVPVLCVGDEEDFFPGEIQEMVLSALSDALKNTGVGTRRYDVLQDIVERNAADGVLEKRAETLKNEMKNYRNLSGTLRQTLVDMGFTITEDGKHYRLMYYGDSRYKTTLAKSASDVREGMNAAQQIIREMM